jgi:signal transduction histidine kinase
LRYEKTLNQCAAVLLTSGESHGIIQKTLTYLISAVEVSRVFVLETIAGSDSHPDLRLRNQVYATNLSPIPEQLSFFSVEELGAWLRILWSGKPITSQISDAAPDESALLEKFGITSILLIPIGQVGNWIGVIGFGETKTERIWDDYDIQLLYTVAQMLYAYLERRQSALELARAHDKAVKANLFKSELLAKVSHELRTPLGAVLGYTQLLHYGSYGDLTNEQKSIAQVVIDSTKYLATLVNGILDQAQLDKGQLVINKAPFQVREMVKEVENRMRFLAENKGLEFIVIVEPSTPNEITGDRVRIEQILTNLLGNAIKFTEEGYVKLRIASPSNAILLFEVSDTGVGIPEKEHSRIFDPFTQVDGSLTRRHDGTGLGLSITKQLIEMMKGLITLNSQVGKGSTFTVEIPH